MDYNQIIAYLSLAVFILNFFVFVHRLINSKITNHKYELFLTFIMSGIMINNVDFSSILQTILYIVLMLMVIVYILLAFVARKK